MGKKRVIVQNEKELLSEKEKVDAKVQKEVSAEALHRGIKDGKIYIFSSYNNTIMSLTDLKGNVLSWASAGAIGFKGTKKSTSFAASKVAEVIFQSARKLGVSKVIVLVKGVGSGRDSAIRSLAAKGLDIVSIKDITPIPHNGCRPRKARRV